MRAIITVGVSSSGKTTWAKEYAQKHKAIISNRDDLRFSSTGAKDWSGYKFDKKIESIITQVQYEAASEAILAHKDFIVADTNLNPLTRSNWNTLLNELNYDVEIKTFPITLEEAWRRDALRPNGVGRDVIYKQWKQWLKFIGRKTYTPDESLPKAILVDLDGTLAKMNDRGPFEWHKVGSDSVDTIVQQIVWDFQKRGYKIVVLSGRDSVCREETYNWLVENCIIYDDLLMRNQGDMRKDSIIKEEIFWGYISSVYNVRAVIDDRMQVIRMWHDIGIPKVICVGNPSEEF